MTSFKFILNVLPTDINTYLNTFTVKEIKSIIPLLSAMSSRKLHLNQRLKMCSSVAGSLR